MYQRKAAGVLDKILGHIAHYCIQEGLPPLTSIVVGKRRGTPGEDIPLNAADLDIAREKVYSYDWYDEMPPSQDELAAALLAFKQKVAPARATKAFSD